MSSASRRAREFLPKVESVRERFFLVGRIQTAEGVLGHAEVQRFIQITSPVDLHSNDAAER